MKYAVILAFAFLLSGCGAKHTAKAAVPAAPEMNFSLNLNPPFMEFQKQPKPNHFCEPDWVPQEGEEITAIECEPLVECDEGQSPWHPWQDICPSKI
jgi:hypothetical protein